MSEINETSSERLITRNKLVMAAAGLGVAVVLCWAGWMVFESGHSTGGSVSPVALANASDSPQKDSVVASVNGITITEMELSGLMQSGVDRAIVVDRYINKVVAAERGRTMYAAEAEAALRAAEREVLSTLYTTKRLEELRKSVSDEQVKNYYDTQVLDQNFQQWKVSYYLSNSNSDAQAVSTRLKARDQDALNQLKPLVEQGDGYAPAAALPYNLGRVVSKMKKGEISEVLALRNGLLILKVEDMRQLSKPTLEQVKDEIIQVLALEKFNAELEQARKQAKVELG
nr:peptidyl-prolyl cis-trans isomerase [uncultured Limnobacter sp.]